VPLPGAAPRPSRPLRRVEGRFVVEHLRTRSAGAVLGELEHSLGDCLPDELGPLATLGGHDGLEQRGDAVVGLHTDLLHMDESIIEPRAPSGTTNEQSAL